MKYLFTYDVSDKACGDYHDALLAHDGEICTADAFDNRTDHDEIEVRFEDGSELDVYAYELKAV